MSNDRLVSSASSRASDLSSVNVEKDAQYNFNDKAKTHKMKFRKTVTIRKTGFGNGGVVTQEYK